LPGLGGGTASLEGGRQLTALRDEFLSLSVLPGVDEPTKRVDLLIRIGRFVEKWGSLGGEAAIVPAGSSDVMFGDPLEDWLAELRFGRDFWDAMLLVRAYGKDEARLYGDQLAALLTWHEAGDWPPRAADEFWRDALGRDPRLGATDLDQGIEFRGNVIRGRLTGMPRPTLSRPASIGVAVQLALETAITLRAHGHFGMIVHGLGNGHITYHPSDLRGALYEGMALGLARKQSGRRCESPKCGRLMDLRRRDQRYCNKKCRDNAGYYRRARSINALANAP
jgi:hypothetical protein